MTKILSLLLKKLIPIPRSLKVTGYVTFWTLAHCVLDALHNIVHTYLDLYEYSSYFAGIPPENAMSPEDMNAASPPPPPPSKCMNSMENIGMYVIYAKMYPAFLVSEFSLSDTFC